MLIGNLGADPDVRSFNNGGEVANLRLATSETWKDRTSGERREKTEWHTVSVFGEGLVGIAKQYLKKGSKVYVEGQLVTRKWQDQDGKDRYATEVHVQGFGGQLKMLDGRGADDQSSRSNSNDRGSNNSGGNRSNNNNSGGFGGGNSNDGFGGFNSDFDDGVPF